MSSDYEIIQDTKLIPDADLDFSPADCKVLRGLAIQVAELAARPIEQEKANLWRLHNDLQPAPPLIFCDPENSWLEIFPPDTLKCSTSIARGWEFQLRKEVFWGTQIKDDRVIMPSFDISHVRMDPDWGLKETRIGGEDRTAYRWESPVKSEADLEKLHSPVFNVDLYATDRMVELANDIFGDILKIRLNTQWWWTLGMTWTLVNLRGLQQLMFDMADNPALVHRLMSVLSNGSQLMLDNLEAKGLLGLNWDGTYVGSGGFGWTSQLPKEGYHGKVRTGDLWGFAESQETVGVSPAMFAEFIFPYQLPLLSRFGLNCYGCCEPVDKRWEYIKQIPGLRRVSVSPWSDRAKMAEYLGKDYVYSMKPIPTDLAMGTFDEDLVRTRLCKDIQAARGCHLEIIMKDNNTIMNDPRRVIRWVELAREELDHHYSP